jgi:NAD(P)-dependent dehydrogenase (short-subunit alcohol dehydrogenase family)
MKRNVLVSGAALGAIAAWRVARRARFRLDGKVVLVTGGSRGLGLLIARELARHPCRLVVCARDAGELERAWHELVGRGAEVLAMSCDVSDRESVEHLVEQVQSRFGPVDVLINNASIIQVGPLETMTLEDFERALAVNFWGTVYPTLALLPSMRARGSGRIVNITSIGGKVAVPHLLPYDCAKFATLGFSEGLRAEAARDGVLVTTVVPGLMRTGSPVNAAYKGDHAREYRWFALGDATALTAMSATRAARRVVAALLRGEVELTLGWQAKLLRLVHALLPSTTQRLLAAVNRLLPGAPTDGDAVLERRGRELEEKVTDLLRRAATDANQFGKN